MATLGSWFRAALLAAFAGWLIVAPSGAKSASAGADCAQIPKALASLAGESERRTVEVAADMRRRIEELELESLTRLDVLVTRHGRAKIRSAFQAVARIIDEMEMTARTESLRQDEALSEVLGCLPPSEATRARLAFERGRNRAAGKFETLYGLQREYVIRSIELADLFERAGDGVRVVAGQPVFEDPRVRRSFEELGKRLSGLEADQAREEENLMAR